MTKRIVRALLILTILLSNVGCDQLSKTVVRQKIDYHERIELIDNVFTLTKVENAGAFLSLGDSLSHPLKSILLAILPLIALGYGLFFLFTRTDIAKQILVGLCFIIGGGIGNIYDRIVYGSVTDFLHIDLGIFQTGIFNMADVSIMIGMALILTRLFSQQASEA